MFQDFRLVRHLSAFDNVALPLRIAGASEEEVEGPVREMLAWVGLADRASARPPTLSGGEQQRVAIARAVIGRPELLVADEPTGNVDADMAQRLLHLFTALNRLGTTVVVATHDVALIARDAGRAADPARERRDRRSDRRAAPSAAPAGARLMLGWLFASPAERRLLGGAPLRGPTPWVIAIMMFVDDAGRRGRARAARHRGAVAQGSRGALLGPDRRRTARPRPRPQAVRSPPGRDSAKAVPEAEMRATARALARPGGRERRPAGAGADRLRRSRPAPTSARSSAAVQAAAPGARLDRPPRERSARWSARCARCNGSRRRWCCCSAERPPRRSCSPRAARSTPTASTIEVMHGIGATDDQVARLFQRKIAVDALARRHCSAGRPRRWSCCCSRPARRFAGELTGGASLSARDLVLLALVPIALTALATWVARAAVLAALRQAL